MAPDVPPVPLRQVVYYGQQELHPEASKLLVDYRHGNAPPVRLVDGLATPQRPHQRHVEIKGFPAKVGNYGATGCTAAADSALGMMAVWKPGCVVWMAQAGAGDSVCGACGGGVAGDGDRGGWEAGVRMWLSGAAVPCF